MSASHTAPADSDEPDASGRLQALIRLLRKPLDRFNAWRKARTQQENDTDDGEDNDHENVKDASSRDDEHSESDVTPAQTSRKRYALIGVFIAVSVIVSLALGIGITYFITSQKLAHKEAALEAQKVELENAKNMLHETRRVLQAQELRLLSTDKALEKTEQHIEALKKENAAKIELQQPLKIKPPLESIRNTPQAEAAQLSTEKNCTISGLGAGDNLKRCIEEFNAQ